MNAWENYCWLLCNGTWVRVEGGSYCGYNIVTNDVTVHNALWEEGVRGERDLDLLLRQMRDHVERHPSWYLTPGPLTHKECEAIYNRLSFSDRKPLE